MVKTKKNRKTKKNKTKKKYLLGLGDHKKK